MFKVSVRKHVFLWRAITFVRSIVKVSTVLERDDLGKRPAVKCLRCVRLRYKRIGNGLGYIEVTSYPPRCPRLNWSPVLRAALLLAIGLRIKGLFPDTGGSRRALHRPHFPALLDGVGQLVRQQLLSRLRVRRVLIAAEHNVIAHSISQRAQFRSRPHRVGAGVYPDIAKIAAETRFEESAAFPIERLARRSRYVEDGCRNLGPISGVGGLALHFLAMRGLAFGAFLSRSLAGAFPLDGRLGRVQRACLRLTPRDGRLSHSVGFQLSRISRLAQSEFGLRAAALAARAPSPARTGLPLNGRHIRPVEQRRNARRFRRGLRRRGFLRRGLGDCHHSYCFLAGDCVWAGGVEGAALGSQGAFPRGTADASTMSREIAAPAVIDIGELSMYIRLHALFDTSR